MRRIVGFCILSVGFMLVRAGGVQARTVTYVDDQGKTHHVNTRYMQVPERYRWQIEEPPAEDVEADEDEGDTSPAVTPEGPESTPPQAMPPAPGQGGPAAEQGSSVPVILYVEPQCQDCRRQEMLLTIGKIPFRKHFLDCPGCDAGVPQKVLRSRKMPVTQVGSDVFVDGVNIRDVRWAIDKATASQPQ